jgi:phage tail sheath protein FI
MVLVSPGVEVSVVDESAYGAPGAGTIPLLVIATRENKSDPTNTSGIAAYTTSATAGQVVRVTSQRELTQYFGNPTFTTSGNSIVQGAETSEYGLMAAYSYLGQGSQAYIVRADVDLGALEPTTTEPVGDWSTNNTVWLDTDASTYGIHEYDATTATWVYQIPTVEVNDSASAAEVTGGVGTYTPSATVVNGGFLVVVHSNPTGSVGLQYFVGVSGSWEELNNDAATSDARTVYYQRHFTQPVGPSDGDVWIKTTTPGNGINLAISVYTTAAGSFVSSTVQGVTTAQVAGLSASIGDFFPQDGSSTTALTTSTAIEGNFLLDLGANTTATVLLQRINSSKAPISLASFAKSIQTSLPTATPATGAVWFDDTITTTSSGSTVGYLDLYKININGYEPVTATYSTVAPVAPSNGDVWVDTSNAGFGQSAERSFPVIKVYNTGAGIWVTHNNTDQTTNNGVLFVDVTDTAADNSNAGYATTIANVTPSHSIYPAGMMVVNMAQSKNTVRVWNGSAWRNGVSNHADGSGRFGRYAQRAYIATEMQAVVAGEDLRDEQYTFSLLAAPGYPELVDELVNLNSDRGETAFIILGAPMRKNPTQAVQWVQNAGVASENGEDGLVTNNTYSAVYYPAGATTEPLNGRTVIVPPEHMALYTYAYNDNISYVWFPPAGTTRGVVQNASAVGYLTSENEFKAISLTQGQRDAMYLNKLNPITTFVGQGTIIYGQKTLHTFTSALDRVNVARLVAYLRERFDSLARPFLFEINDQQTRERAKLVFERFLADILSRRGIYDFAVVCDESNNTPARIDRNELYIDVAIEPAKSTEFIYIPIRIVNTGTLATTV